MPERLTRYDRGRWGIESTPGTSPTSNFKRIDGFGVQLGINAEFDEFTPPGLLVPTIVSSDREYTDVVLDGRVDFNGIVYALSAAFGSATITTPAGLTLARQWDWTPSTSTEIAPVTFTVEKGQSAYATRSAYVSLSRLGIEWGRGALPLTGNGFGRSLQGGITLTDTGLTTVSAQPAYGKNVTVTLDNTFSAIGTTALTRVVSGSWEFGTGRGPAFYVNDAAQDYQHTVDQDPAREVHLVVQADSTGMGPLTAMRDGSTRYMRVSILGPIIEGATRHMVRIDMAIKVSAAPSFGDQNSVYGADWTFGLVQDAALGGACSIRVMNTLAAL